MPTYDYSCDACRHEFEVFEPITAEPQKKCPKCKKNRLRRLFGTGAGLIFKGSGFYSTDYRSESYKEAAKKEAAPKATEGGDKSSKTEPAKTSSSGETKTAEKKSTKESG